MQVDPAWKSADKPPWERNGQRMTTGNRPEDPALWNNRFRLYDRYGRWRIDPAYQAPPANKKQGVAESLIKKKDLLPLATPSQVYPYMCCC